MAQTKRRRKHRGTQAGTIERAGRTGRPRTKAEARTIARERRLERLERPPTWRGSLNRAAIAAAVFGVLVILVFGQPLAAGASLAAVMLLIYIPMSYYTDLFIYRRRQRRKQAGRA
jgi:Flp pilus assembly protein TadB